MAETPKPGTFIWHELYTPDAEAAQRFYGELFGWDSGTDEFAPGMRYTMFRHSGEPLAGIMPTEYPDMTVPPHWLTYVAVEDAAATVQKAEALGAKVLQAPKAIPNVGTVALIEDPAGAVIALFRPEMG